MPGRFKRWLKGRRPVFSARAHRKAKERAAQLREHIRTSGELAADSSRRAMKAAEGGQPGEAAKQRAAAEEFGRWGAGYGDAAKGYNALAESKKPWRLLLREAIFGKRKK